MEKNSNEKSEISSLKRKRKSIKSKAMSLKSSNKIDKMLYIFLKRRKHKYL